MVDLWFSFLATNSQRRHSDVIQQKPLTYELLAFTFRPSDGVLISLSKMSTEKLRHSLKTLTNCYLYLGDKFSIAHFELRWAQHHQQSVHFTSPLPAVTSSPVLRTRTTGPRPYSGVASTLNSAIETVPPASWPEQQSYPGYGVIRVSHTGLARELQVAARVFDNVDRVLSDFEQRINQVCEEPLMKHANKMTPGEATKLHVRLVLEPGNKVRSAGNYLGELHGVVAQKHLNVKKYMFNPFHSQEWSVFCSLTRNLTPHRMKIWLFIAYSDERLIMLPILTSEKPIHFSWKVSKMCVWGGGGGVA